MNFRLFGFDLRIHEGGRPTLVVVGTACILLFLISGINALSASALFLLACIGYFFRDPERITPKKSDIVVSAADGIVTSIKMVEVPKVVEQLAGQQMMKISTFLSVMDVHVVRAPVPGVVTSVKYNKGKFISAAKEKESMDNEQNAFTIQAESGQVIGCVELAGLIARRIDSTVAVGNFVGMGDRVGIIKFGSRVDIYLPSSANIQVEVGQRMVGGETIVALLA